MSVTSLTGTTWIINSSPAYSPFTNSSPIKQTNIYADFESDGTQYASISIFDLNGLMITYNGQYSISAYSSSSGWASESKRTITFLEEPYNGGHAYDATVEQTIAWLEANAVQVVPDVVVSLGSSSIASLDDTGSVTLATQNTYLTNDITVSYTKSGGGVVPSGTISIASNGTYDVASYASAFVNVSGGGGDSALVDFIENRSAMTSFTHSSITVIGFGAFALCPNLSTVSFPSCTSIESYAFGSCSKIQTASFPVCLSIGSSAFISCYSLTTANFPECTSIGTHAFYYCYSLQTISFPVCNYIGQYAFQYCSSLTTVNFPSCSSTGYCAFAQCYKLKSAYFPVCSTISTATFSNCSSLTTVSSPVCQTIGTSAFYSCRNLQTLSFPSCTSIYNSAFMRCYNLVSLYLLGSSIPSLANSNAFSSTPIAGYTTSTGGVYGSIFVPSSLYSSYKTATNWTYFSSRFVSV